MTTLPARHAAPPGARLDAPPRQVRGMELATLRLTSLCRRMVCWEFWPSWIVYLPLVPWITWLAFRYKGVATCTACNPCIPLGGLVGESKSAILAKLPQNFTVDTALIPEGSVEHRLAVLRTILSKKGWSWPIILKPDVGERGAGVRMVSSAAEAAVYFSSHAQPVIAQEYHSGPFEAGVFYVRFPGHATGQIFSITDKVFPVITGDGASTYRSLIWRHPRYRCQAMTFLRRLGTRADEVPPAGMTVRLGVAGNHCQGTMFRDGAHLITPQLSAAFDAIADSTPGFFFGRFDVRYTDPAAFTRGKDFKIVELNGLLAESTNIYDPRTSYWQAQRTLRRQWQLAFQIGSANRKRGAEVPALHTILRTVRNSMSDRTRDVHAD